jgi:hypothetical protein
MENEANLSNSMRLIFPIQMRPSSKFSVNKKQLKLMKNNTCQMLTKCIIDYCLAILKSQLEEDERRALRI